MCPNREINRSFMEKKRPVVHLSKKRVEKLICRLKSGRLRLVAQLSNQNVEISCSFVESKYED